MKIKITLEIELEDAFWGSEEDEKLWLENEVLVASALSLHSDEVGDYVGTVKKVSNVQYIS